MNYLLAMLILMFKQGAMAPEISAISWHQLIPEQDRISQQQHHLRHGLTHQGGSIQPSFGFVRPELNHKSVMLSWFIMTIERAGESKPSYVLVPRVEYCEPATYPPNESNYLLKFSPAASRNGPASIC